MAFRDVITIPNPVLRKKAHVVTDFGPALQTLIDDMIDTMRAEPGVGLAAPQIGASQRVIVVEYPVDEEDEDAEAKLYAVVNPEIVRASTEQEEGPEGCLSVPNLRGTVERSIELTIKGKSRRGQPIKFKLKGWTARIFQHEMDHLDGILFIDRASEVWEYKDEQTPAV
ncbi:MAG: peptide deformylase [Chloroflexota bacterium]|jgi:peptide deformylase